MLNQQSQKAANPPSKALSPDSEGRTGNSRPAVPVLQNKSTLSTANPGAALASPVQNNTGLPDNLKAGVEHLSGVNMDDVKVHYNSGKPAQLQALAYAKGTDIHIGPGQEKHLAHEAWHVVQQKRQRVQPTIQANGLAINDDKGLELEADRMGKKAMDADPVQKRAWALHAKPNSTVIQGMPVVQRVGEEILASLLSPAGLLTIGTIGTSYLTYTWWPAGRTPTDLFQIARGLGFFRRTLIPDVLAIGNMATWNSAAIIQLAQLIGINANGLSVSEWITIAGRVQLNAPAEAAAFARLAGWTYAGGINQLTLNFQGAPNGLTAQQWASVAGSVAHDNHAAATAFASLANWTYAGGINSLSQNFSAGNPGNLTAQEWVAIAGRVNNDDHAAATALARLAGWTYAGGIDSLSQNIPGGNPRNFTVHEWIAIAGELANDAHAQTTAFARMPLWTAQALRILARRFATSNPFNRDIQYWITVATLHNTFLDQYDHVRDFLNLAAGWSDAQVVALANLYSLDAGGRPAITWNGIANAHANLYNNRMAVSTFARTQGWNNGNVIQLAQQYAVNNPNNFSASQWSNFATAHAGLHNQPIVILTFAGMPNWNYPGVLDLLTGFSTNNPRGFTPQEWIAIANAHPNLYNIPADVIAFARMNNWSALRISTQLVLSYAGFNPNNFTAGEWIAIANAHAVILDRGWDTASFARMANWIHANIVNLVQLFGGNNPRNFTVNQWISIANAHGNFRNQENNVSSFACMANWNLPNIILLANHFAVNANGRSSLDWTLIANADVALYNMENNARDFALLPNGITRADLQVIIPILFTALNTHSSITLINHLFPALTRARLVALISVPVNVANLDNASLGAHGGQSFAQIMNNLMAGGWTGANAAAVLDEMNTPGNAPTANAFSQLLDLAHRHNLPSARLVATLTNVNPVAIADWVIICQEFDNFVNAGHAQPAGPFGMGGAVVGNSYTYYSMGATNIYVEMQFRQQRLNHFESGHTYESFLFTWANAHRAGSPYSFWAPGTDVSQQADLAIGNGIRAEAVNAVRNNGFAQGAHGGFNTGFEPVGAAVLIDDLTYESEMTQFFPQGANVHTSINSQVLEAVGRLLGHI